MDAVFPRIKVVEKGWGYERWLFNTDRLCVKELVLYPFKSCSIHFHKNKQEVFYVKNGVVTLTLIDTTTALKHVYELSEGQSVIINPLVPHRIKNISDKDCIIIESSTHHEDNDSYRVEPGDSQK